MVYEKFNSSDTRSLHSSARPTTSWLKEQKKKFQIEKVYCNIVTFSAFWRFSEWL